MHVQYVVCDKNHVSWMNFSGNFHKYIYNIETKVKVYHNSPIVSLVSDSSSGILLE